MSDSKYLQVLDYLRTYGGKQYKKAEKCESPEELAFMEKGSEEGKKARNSFTGMVQLLNNKTDLSPDVIAGADCPKIDGDFCPDLAGNYAGSFSAAGRFMYYENSHSRTVVTAWSSTRRSLFWLA